ncbi:hypothetical protein SCHPADRAFT_943633 [Schizopora paradoxa]|uniref:Serine hydrolase domain-containing protein n=1 Tax=Schizopora paradoxa TaxID=27342 RepID=A0A0H2RD78_9AGAM|nr:hypothetical protein SCHPADRAFT_943633 [Schizopora paradoxa]
MKRVLVLHGHTESAHLFGRKFNDIRDALKDEVEFVFLDAPHLLTPVDPQGAPIFSTAPQFEKLTHLDPQQPTDLTPRAWYFHLRDAQDVWAVSQSLVYIRNFIEKEGPFQGAMGYSQGGAMAALLAGSLENPEHMPHFKGIKHPPLEFLITFSSFIIPNVGFEVPKNMRTPTLVVLGLTDTVVLPEHTLAFSKQFCKPNMRLEVHTGGHYVPRQSQWRTFLIELLGAFAKSPDSASGSVTVPPLFQPKFHGIDMQTSAFANAMLPFAPGSASDVAKPKAQEPVRKSRRKSWTEVMPRTAWEGGFEEMDEIDEEETEVAAMEPVKFDEGYSFGATAATITKGLDPSARVHFFEADAPGGTRASPRPKSDSATSFNIDVSTPSTPSSYSDDGLSEPSPTPSPRFQPTVPASILLKKSDFTSKSDRAKAGGSGRRASFQINLGNGKKVEVEVPEGGLRFKTTGGREIVLQSSYEPDEVPFDYAIDLENGFANVDDGQEVLTDGA